ncbi:T9SS type A sorting domain-containing protein [Marinilabiliaceae bacterium ANBcel2]|nr:T9SS type A sorting domain-containing protein [Marinilabiliaceae bacterium ANBcel2]
MKKIFTVILIIGVTFTFHKSYAQEDITPSGYDFSQMEVGEFTLDAEFATANPPNSWEFVTDYWNDRFVAVGGGAFETSTDLSSNMGSILQTYFQIVDLGGEVGKVLMMKGPNNSFEYGEPGDEGFWPGWFNLSFYTDPDNTPSIAGVIDQGVDEEDAEKHATVRMRVVFHIHQNEIETSNKLFDILGYTYTGMHKQVDGSDAPTREFRSGDFASVEFDPITETEVFEYNPDKWIVCEYDFVANEESGVPLRYVLRFGESDFTTTALMIKEISFIANPEGEPVEMEEIQLSAGDPTNVSIPGAVSTLDYYTTEGNLHLNNLSAGQLIEIYSITGQKIDAVKTVSGSLTIPLNRGFYIVRVDQEAVKVSIQ